MGVAREGEKRKEEAVCCLHNKRFGGLWGKRSDGPNCVWKASAGRPGERAAISESHFRFSDNKKRLTKQNGLCEKQLDMRRK